VRTSANRISRENNNRRIAIKCNLVNRDQGSFVKDAMAKVKEQVELPAGYRLVWSGQFENQQRAMKRLYVIVPISLLFIFSLLFWAFKSAQQSLLIMLNVPFGLAGGIILLWLLGIHLSISAAVGFITRTVKPRGSARGYKVLRAANLASEVCLVAECIA
jgi:cobalt-zinc-cadmium resistance protein CzcA